MGKIALLFLTRKELNHPRIWEKILENREEQFNIYIHSKEPLEDPFFKKYRISTLVPTSYLMHGHAWQVLIREALKDEENELFIYLSESCMPLYPLNELYHYLIRDPQTFIRYGKPWWPRESEREITEIPIEHRWGNSEWIILNRHHASLIAEDQEVIELASKHVNSDHEAYPSSLLSLKGCLDQVIYRETTYANFSTPEGPHPYHFHNDHPIEAQYLHRAKRAGYLFARKFTPEFPSNALTSTISERLMLSPASIFSDSSKLTPELEKKILLLQSQEELSQANICALFPALLNEGFFEVCYEIGTGLGLHMERLLQSVYLEKYYTIDDYARKNYQGISFESNEEDILYEYVQKRIERLNLNAELIRASSLEIAQTIPDRSIDVVFFNTEHQLIPIQDNLLAWFPKVRKGGIIAGYQKTIFYPHLSPELHQFFSDKQLQVNQECVEPKFWWVEL